LYGSNSLAPAITTISGRSTRVAHRSSHGHAVAGSWSTPDELARLTPEQRALYLEVEASKDAIEAETGVRPDFINPDPPGFGDQRPSAENPAGE
jgi:hypothetical protein